MKAMIEIKNLPFKGFNQANNEPMNYFLLFKMMLPKNNGKPMFGDELRQRHTLNIKINPKATFMKVDAKELALLKSVVAAFGWGVSDEHVIDFLDYVESLELPEETK